MDKNRLIIFFCIVSSIYAIEKIDINKWCLVDINSIENKLTTIPIDKNKIFKIYEYINFYGEINSIYEILNINDLTAEEFKIVKQHTFIKNGDVKSNNNFSYKFLKLLSEDSQAEDGISANLVDRYFFPYNVNDIHYDELLSLTNVSPMDAVAVLKQQQLGEIKGTFQLKNSPGISYYGYKNLLDFVNFGNINNKSKSYILRVGFLSNDSPSLSGLNEDDGLPINYLYNQKPQTLSKISLLKYFNNGNGNLNIGLLRHNNMGDPDFIYDKKAFLSLEGINFCVWVQYNPCFSYTKIAPASVPGPSSPFLAPARIYLPFAEIQQSILKLDPSVCVNV